MTASISNSWDTIDLGLEPEPALQVPRSPSAHFSRPMNLSEDDSFFSDLRPGSSVSLYEDEEPTQLITLPSSWPAQLPMALAMDLEEEDEILARFSLTKERYELLKPLPAFRKALAEAQKDLRENGHTFKAKARVIAEDYLDHLYRDCLHKETVGISTKVDVWKYLVKVGGLEPAPAKLETSGAQSTVSIVINLDAPGGGAPSRSAHSVIDI